MYSKFLYKKENEILSCCASKTNATIFGCGYGEKSLLVSEMPASILYVANDIVSASKLYEQFVFLGKKVNILTNRISNYNYNDFSKNTVVSEIINFLYNIDKNDINIITSDVLTQKLPNHKIFNKNILKISKGQIIPRDELVKKLVSMGYYSVDNIFNKGEFSVKGDLVDIFAVNMIEPIKVDYFDDEIESVYSFSLDTYKKIENFDKIEIAPNTIVFLQDEDLPKLINDDINESKLSIPAKNKAEEIYDKVKSKYDTNSLFGCVYILPYLKSFNATIFDYISSTTAVVYDEPKKIKDDVINLAKEARASFELLSESGEANKRHKNFYVEIEKTFLTNNVRFSFQNLNSNTSLFESEKVFTVESMPSTNYNYNFNQLIKDLFYWQEDKFTVVIYAFDKEFSSRLNDNLKRNNIYAIMVDSQAEVIKGKINIIPKPLTYSAYILSSEFIIISSNDITSKRKKHFISSRDKTKVFKMPKVGEYVVHNTHGIGLCDGIKTLTLNGYQKDYLVIKFKGSDILYLPTENIDNISLYLGGDKEPKLNKLGGAEFTRAKNRVKENVSKIAIKLVKLYNERQNLKGYKYEINHELYDEFVQSFPYNETEDQLNAIKDIENDMKIGKVMDRLICGDVGYGKTEVALRAAYMTILSNKQVAFLCPTTILSEQHFNTVTSRLSMFGVSVSKLNRFANKSQQNQTTEDLKLGKVDIVCGTHRLLSSDVGFKDLGLLILDEEHRFGVKDKEKIKELKKNVNVLTLSATPIPRTLHMSMVGIRDMSIIETPPTNRLPVQTFVTEYSETLVKDAIYKEINRGGQVLFIYNRVESIMGFANQIQQLIPDLKIGIAHGQMPQKILEQAIIDLYNGTTQVLIATTLIENGIDLPNANTLIVYEADKLGLSQLYQLRGRVGRSSRLGYAYLTYLANKSLSELAYKRLDALQEFSTLGSGFKIAMRDLEIRGAGNVLGGEQHGHMEKVGYDMYCKLLNNAIKEINGQKIKEFKDVKINIKLDALIPHEFVSNNEDRIKIYSALGEVSSKEDLSSRLDELENVYGKLPTQIINLGMVALAKNLAQKLDISRITLTSEENYFMFYELDSLLLPKVNNALKNAKDYCVINYSKMPIIYLQLNNLGTFKKLEYLINLFTLCSKK